MSITDIFKKATQILPPLKEVLSENGVGSYARYSGFIITLSTIAWVTFLVAKNHALPDLEGPSLFIAAGQGSYGLGQIKHVAEAARKIKQINQADNQVIVQQQPPSTGTPPAAPGGDPPQNGGQ